MSGISFITFIRRYIMNYSARNVFKGKVNNLKKGPVNTEVTIGLPGGIEIVATITTTSADSMGLKEGSDATALIKATSVIIAAD